MIVTSIDPTWAIIVLIILNTVLEGAFFWLAKLVIRLELEPILAGLIVIYGLKWVGLFNLIQYIVTNINQYSVLN